MAEDRNMNFQHGGVFPQSFCNQQVVSFQSGAVNSTAGMIGTDNISGISSTAGMILANNPAVMINNASLMIPPSNSPSNILLEPVPGLKHGIGLAVDWSYEELAVLRDGLDSYANEPNIMKYIKIAARLPDKTVRDVAMRCRWMTKKENGKRRKQEEYYAGKKIKDGKEKMVDCSTRARVHPIQQDNAAAYSLMMHHGNHNNQFSCEAPVIDGATRHLLGENAQLFNGIAANLATFQIQNNIELFCCTRNNITTIINSMSEMPGIMSQMPPLPVSINEALFSSILPCASQDSGQNKLAILLRAIVKSSHVHFMHAGPSTRQQSFEGRTKLLVAEREMSCNLIAKIPSLNEWKWSEISLLRRPSRAICCRVPALEYQRSTKHQEVIASPFPGLSMTSDTAYLSSCFRVTMYMLPERENFWNYKHF